MTRRRVAAAVLAFVAIWPLAHRGLVARYDVDPSLFFGFARHSVPPVWQWVHIMELRDGRELNVYRFQLSTELREFHKNVARRRIALGKLYHPHRFAEELLETQVDAQGVKIIMIRDEVSRETSRIVSNEGVAYTYER